MSRQRLTAFELYLLSLTTLDAARHIIDCLKHWDEDNCAWSFMSEFNGPDWQCRPEDLGNLIVKSIHRLRLKQMTIEQGLQ